MARRKAKVQKAQPEKPPAVDPVAEASDESFPASDAPAWPSGESNVTKGKKRKEERLIPLTP